MLLLALSILALGVGPVVYHAVRKRDAMLSLLDGLIFVTITGLVLFLILPGTFATGGWIVMVFATLGFLGPTLLETSSRRLARRTHIIAMALGLAGLVLHALVDGTALSEDQAALSSSSMLPLAIVLHRLPVGLTIWWLLRPNFGIRLPLAVLSLISLATTVGYQAGPWLTAGLSSDGIAWFQALVAGSLLHVVFHQPHLKSEDCGCGQVSRETNWYEGIGALLGIGIIAALLGEGSVHGQEWLVAGVSTFSVLALESAPALLIGYVMAGALHIFMPRSSVQWMHRGTPLVQSLRGMAVGLPFPVCSCGVVPIYQTLIRKGAPATAGMAFLIATPELGLDAVLISIPLLGTEMTVIRVVAAALTAALVGRVVGSLCSVDRQDEPVNDTETKEPKTEPVALSRRIRASLSVGLVEVVDHTGPWIVLGILIASLAHPYLVSGWLSGIPEELQVPLFTLLGLPAYVCASGATPLVAVLLATGTTPGAALAFLLTGPATNVTTFGLLARLHSRSIALVFSLAIIGFAMLVGYMINWVLPTSGAGALNPSHAEATSTFQLACLIILGGTYLYSVLRRGARRFVGELFFQDQRAIDLHPHYH